mmetsp:Transcript_6541/g.15721  ORF Transcript_6541/g.15721 Transcript_6541/m.15721 type:complete len:326 (-) Transcript_6541:244-1221(-)
MANTATLLFVNFLGPCLIAVFGGVRSTLHSCSTLSPSFPASSVTPIVSLWYPSRSPLTVMRMRRLLTKRAVIASVCPAPPPPLAWDSAPSHSSSGPRRYCRRNGNLHRSSDATASNRALPSRVILGGFRCISTRGLSVSTHHWSSAGLGSRTLFASTALARNTWWPSGRGCLNRSGLWAGIHRLLSSWISKLQPPRSAVNFMIGLFSGECFAGPSRIVVRGATGRLERATPLVSAFNGRETLCEAEDPFLFPAKWISIPFFGSFVRILSSKSVPASVPESISYSPSVSKAGARKVLYNEIASTLPTVSVINGGRAALEKMLYFRC